MKTLVRTFKRVVIGIGLMVLVTAPAYAQEPKGKVVIKDTRIEIHPGIKLTPKDEEAFNKILDKHSDKLFKIEKYDKGALRKGRGKLEDVKIDKKLAADVEKAKRTHALTDVTNQVVNGRSKGNEAFLKEARKVLEKYQEKR